MPAAGSGRHRSDMEGHDRTCVITGASRGIGREIALELADEGYNIVVNYRSSEGKAAELADRIQDETSGTAIMVQADVTDFEATQAMYEQTAAAFDQADILINNAGITKDTTFQRMDPDEWHDVINVHLNGMFNSTKAFFDDIQSAEEGRLINISSIVGKQGNFGQANYAAAKSGMFGFTKTLALELAPSGSTANCVAPGFTKTDMLSEVNEELQEQIREQIPLKRLATVEDIVPLIRFLAGEDSGYITGEVIDVNGGIDL